MAVDPVTAAGATSVIGDAVTSTVSSAATSAGNWFTNMLGAPFRAVGGAARAVLGSFWTGLTLTGVIAAVKVLSPELWRSLDTAVGGEERAARTAAMVERDGVGGVVLESAMQGFGVAAAGHAASGAISAGGLIPGLAVTAAVGAVAIGALSSPTTPAGGTGGRAAGDTRSA